MSIDLKQDITQAVRKGNCAKYKDNSHACWWCPCSVFENDNYICKNAALDTSEEKVPQDLGGEVTINLPPNEKLEVITWKEDSLWYLTRPMREDEEAETHVYKQSSEWGVFEGTVTIIETKGE